MWTVLFVSGSVLVVYQVQKQIQQFIGKPINTQTSVNYNRVMKLPAITICNSNQFRYYNAYKYYVVL